MRRMFEKCTKTTQWGKYYSTKDRGINRHPCESKHFVCKNELKMDLQLNTKAKIIKCFRRKHSGTLCELVVAEDFLEGTQN